MKPSKKLMNLRFFARYQRYLIFVFSIFILCSCTESKKNKKASYVDLMKSDILSDKALVKSWNLLETGQKMANQGKNTDDILKTFPIGTRFSRNENSLLFFVDGSIPMIIELDKNSKQSRLYKGGNNESIPKFKFKRPSTLKVNSLPSTIIADEKRVDVVGSNKSDDERQQKKALIIAPFNSTDFKGSDDADVAYRHLKTNRNYKDNINFRKENITLEDFTAFDQYDLVHLSTHGENFCESDEIIYNSNNEIEWIDISHKGCYSLITTGIEHGFDDINDEEQIKELKKVYKNFRGAITLSSDKIFLRPIFFNYFYKSGLTNNIKIKGDLKNKIWIFSACELGQNGMMQLIMEDILEEGHFFGWENSVLSKHAYVAFEEFYKNLVFKGLDASKSFEQIPENLKTNLIYDREPSNKYSDSIIYRNLTTSLEHLQTGAPKHGIEVIDMLNPENEKLLVLNDFYPLVGDFNDGIDETMTLKVKLIGYTKAEFIEQQMSISLDIDDKTVLNKQSFLPDEPDDAITVEALKEHEYGVIVTINDIEIPDVGTKEELTLKAILHLNDEHISIHKETVSIVGKGIIATVKGQGASVKYVYDSKTKAVKMTTPKGPIYYDSIGFVYTNMGRKGWMKMANKGMNMRQFSFMPAGIRLKSQKIAEIDAATSSLPEFINFAIKFRMIAFETNEKFKKTLVDCGKPVECNKFTSSEGIHALFNPSGKLIEYGFNHKMIIKYTYGDYDVKLPEAKIFEMPVLDFKKAQLEWGKRGIDIRFN